MAQVIVAVHFSETLNERGDGVERMRTKVFDEGEPLSAVVKWVDGVNEPFGTHVLRVTLSTDEWL